MIDFDKLIKYSEENSTPEDDALYKINRETHLEMIRPRMLSGHIQGLFLQLLSSLKQPKNVLELGTFTAYGAICLTQGLVEGGKLITIEKNIEFEDRILQNIEAAGKSEQIELMLGDALELIPNLNTNFDLIYLDSDKVNYPKYLDLLVPIMNKGALLLADNVLWDGKVVMENIPEKDKDTRAIIEFNKKVTEDKRLRNILLPLRDGLMIAEKL